jgi:hypothetical protein
MMADKTAVFVAGEDGKPKQLASFDSKSDAAFFARQRLTRYGKRNYVGPADNKDAIEAALKEPAATRPLNSGMEARVASMRAQVMQEQTDAEIRSAVEGSTKLTDDVTEAVEAAAEPESEAKSTEAKSTSKTKTESK